MLRWFEEWTRGWKNLCLAFLLFFPFCLCTRWKYIQLKIQTNCVYNLISVKLLTPKTSKSILRVLLNKSYFFSILFLIKISLIFLYTYLFSILIPAIVPEIVQEKKILIALSLFREISFRLFANYKWICNLSENEYISL